ncbi:ABC transporter ATP-binding protein, partial [Streptomyces calidiresistens]
MPAPTTGAAPGGTMSAPDTARGPGSGKERTAHAGGDPARGDSGAGTAGGGPSAPPGGHERAGAPDAAGHTAGEPPLLRVSGLRTHFETDDGVVRAVDGVDLVVNAGRIVCVVGESGCGKSVTARSVLGLVDPPGRVVGGTVQWRGGGRSTPVDPTALHPRDPVLRSVRGGEIAMVFQEPMASLSPMHTIGDQLVETIRLHRGMNRAEARDHAISVLRRVGIPQPERRFDAYSFQLSGGMCQRVMIAMGLSCDPDLLIADEPTTALDVTIQARILDLLLDLRESTGLAVLFITHDLGVVAEIADEVVVMYLGTVVERGPVDDIFHHPRHPYTRALLASVPGLGAEGGPAPDPSGRGHLPQIRGRVPHPSERPTGCPFHPRCDEAIAGVCDAGPPPEVVLGPDRTVRCVLYGDPPDTSGTPDPARAAEGPLPGEDP